MYFYKNIPCFLITISFISLSGNIHSKTNSTDSAVSLMDPSYSGSPNFDEPYSYNASLFYQQWYIKNNGKELYNFLTGTPNIDINLTMPNKWKGSGVKVLIADSDIDSTHPNLKDNILPGDSIDFTKDPIYIIDNPIVESGQSHHGTNVAGVIAGKPLEIPNGFTGIAPDAKIASANITNKSINYSKYTNFKLKFKTYEHALNKNFSIINESFGNEKNFNPELMNNEENIIIYDKIKNNARNLQNQGFIIVKAGGNGTCENSDLLEKEYFKNFDESVIYDYDGSQPLGSKEELYFKSLRPIMSQIDYVLNNPYIISVANATSKGIINYSSSIGANLWITAFGSGFRSAEKNDKLLTLIDKNETYEEKYTSQIFTTRVHSDPNNKDQILQQEKFPKEYQDLYTFKFSQTSAATPMVSGVIALMLQANPNLTLRDVKYILAKTANYDKVKEFQPKPYCIKALEKLNEFKQNFNIFWDEKSWVKNAEGFHFNNYYGFGLLDADKAIEKAEEFAKNNTHIYNNPTEEKEFFSNEYEIDTTEIKSGEMKEFTLNVNEELQIEAIQVTPAISAFKADGLGIKIKSPSGTESILLYPGNSFIDTTKEIGKVSIKPYPLYNIESLKEGTCCSYLSNAFYEESSYGNWTISVLNSNKTEPEVFEYARMKGWKIKIIGHKKNQ